MSENKEPGYFFRDNLYQNEQRWYSSLFEAGQDKKYRGESSTYYFNYAPAIERMKKDLDNPKFIIVIRHPVKRVVSHYFWLRGKGLEFRPFRDAIKNDFKNQYGPGIHIKNHYKFYLLFSSYYEWIKRYHTAFDQENVTVITSEKLRQDPLTTLNGCFVFLGLDPLPRIDEMTSNKSIHRNIPLWDSLLLNFLFQENDKRSLINLKNTMIPEFFKQYYWKFHSKVTFKRKLDTKPEISSKDYQWVLSLLKKEVRQLKDYLQYNFDEWEDLKAI